MNRKKLVKNLKLYNLIMSNIWLLLTTTLLGVIIGYILKKNNDNDTYMVISIIVFFVIGIVNFFFKIIRETLKMNKEEKDV